MTLWFPKTDLFYTDVKETRVGRFKMWIHFHLLRTWVYPMMPWDIRKPFYHSVRRWVFGPNANNEDLNALIQECIDLVKVK
jgi:hypothetical protein